MKRIYFLSPDLETTRRIVDDLLLARIEERHIHVLAKRGTPLEELPEATLMQKSDFVPAVQRGLALGGGSGVLAGLVAIALPGASPVIAGGVLLGTALAGAGIGAWLGGMVGMNVGNTRLRRFEKAIESGQLLVLVDVPRARVEEIETWIKQHLPRAQLKGTEPTIPAFP
jgi:anti-sigma factor RsiW